MSSDAISNLNEDQIKHIFEIFRVSEYVEGTKEELLQNLIDLKILSSSFEFNKEKLQILSVINLKRLLNLFRAKVGGNKKELIDRLMNLNSSNSYPARSPKYNSFRPSVIEEILLTTPNDELLSILCFLDPSLCKVVYSYGNAEDKDILIQNILYVMKDPFYLAKRRVDDLKEILRFFGAKISGRKQELIDRIVGLTNSVSYPPELEPSPPSISRPEFEI